MEIRPKRSHRLSLAQLLVAGLSAVNLGRAISWQIQKGVLTTLHPQLNPTLAIFSALLWAGLFAAMAWLGRRSRPSLRLVWPGLLGLYGFYRLGLVGLMTSSLTRRNEAWLLVGYCLTAAYLIWAGLSPSAQQTASALDPSAAEATAPDGSATLSR